MDHVEYRFYVKGDVGEFIHGLGASETEFGALFNNMEGTYASFGVSDNEDLYLIHLCKDELKDSCNLELAVNSKNKEYKFSICANDHKNTFVDCRAYMGLQYALNMIRKYTVRITSQKRLGKYIVPPMDMLDSIFTKQNTPKTNK